LLQRVMNNSRQRLQETVRRCGEHLRAVIFKPWCISINGTVSIMLCYFHYHNRYTNFRTACKNPSSPTAGSCIIIIITTMIIIIIIIVIGGLK
jgi:heme/copper-type cytochrome/quinol oxidase subunit 2